MEKKAKSRRFPLWPLAALILQITPAGSESQCPSDSYEVSFEHLQRESEFCLTCPDPSSQSPSFRAAQKAIASVPTLSCFQSSIRQKIKNHNICPNGVQENLERKTKRPICFSDKYTSDTARVFYDVAKCLGMEKPEYFFALINRESRFQITARSPTGASCYGQLTGVAIADVNIRFLPYPGKDKKSCETINKYFDYMPTTGIRRVDPQTTCAAHSNPYSCLMYSAVYYTQALEKAKKLIDSLDIVIVTIKGKPKERLIFKTEEEFERHFNKPENSKSNIASLRRISLLQDKETAAQILAFQSYNGGPESTRNLFKSYIRDIKGFIWGGGSKSKDYIKQIFSKKPWGIAPGDFLETFSNYTKKGHRQETVSFPENVLNDYHQVTSGLAPSCGNIPYDELTKPPGRFKASGMI